MSAYKEKPVYIFQPQPTPAVFRARRIICLLFFLPFLCVTVFLFNTFSAPCQPAGDFCYYTPYMLLAFAVLFGFVGISAGIISPHKKYLKKVRELKKTQYCCFPDRIEMPKENISCKSFISIDFVRFGGGIGSIFITHTQVPDDFDFDTDVLVLEEVPDVRDAYLKIKLLYNLPEKRSVGSFFYFLFR